MFFDIDVDHGIACFHSNIDSLLLKLHQSTALLLNQFQLTVQCFLNTSGEKQGKNASRVCSYVGTQVAPQMELTQSADRWCSPVGMHQHLFLFLYLSYAFKRQGQREPVLLASRQISVLCCFHLCSCPSSGPYTLILCS